MVDYALLAPVAGLVALAFSAFLVIDILRRSPGNERMQEISQAVRDGAMAFMKLEYKVILIFGVLLLAVFAIVGATTGNHFWYNTAGGFALGAALSALAGFIGMAISVRSNARVAESARSGLKPALALSFRAGAVNGFAVVGLGLLGLSLLYYVFKALIPMPDATVLAVGVSAEQVHLREVTLSLIGFAFGASLITLFARIAGGIYTKAADVGADLVGKVEANIPEDDPRNPAVIADNVGDNVGDCAGMGADLFETYVVTLVAAMALAGSAAIFSANLLDGAILGEVGITYPLTLAAFAVVASIFGMYAVRLPASGNIMRALYNGVFVTVGISAIGFYGITVWMGVPMVFFWASVIGLALVIALVLITDYYTSTNFKPVRSISDASTTGPGTNIIQGLAVGLESVALPALFIVGGLVFSYLLGWSLGGDNAAMLGLYAVAIAGVGMLSVAGMVVALDTYGPITDNAGGIAEMAELPPNVREVTDALDAVGNTTKATTKGYAIGSAALAALVLFADFVDHASESAGREIRFEIDNPFVLAGLLVGAAVVFLFAAYAMRAVGRAAKAIVENVRVQFADGQILAGKRKPDYASCVAIVTRAALKEMVVPGLLAVLAPLAVGFLLGVYALGGLLIGVIVAGLALALLMANGGGAWDNAKKLIESDKKTYGGKGSESHKAAVVGDTVGDPFKDTAGPAINPLIKAINTIAVIFAGIVVAYSAVGL